MSQRRSMSVRGRTLLVGGLCSVAFVVVGTAVKVPYVLLGPGVTINTLGEYDGAEVFTFTGPGVPEAAEESYGDGSHLNMTTVSVTDGISLFQAIGSWATGKYTVTPRDEQFPPGQTKEERTAENRAFFVESQSLAEIVALRHLEYPEATFVQSVTDEAPAAAVLEVQDKILRIDGEPITDLDSVAAALAGTTPGQEVIVDLERPADTEEGTVSELSVAAELTEGPADGEDRGYLGITVTARPQSTFQIHNSLENSQIGGPSAGLMFTLGIIDRLTPGDLTSGHFVAGTGEIKLDEKVGAIGGIQLKLIAARDVGATVFLVPRDNCDEALTNVPDGLTLAGVADLDEALTALEDLAAGRAPAGC